MGARSRGRQVGQGSAACRLWLESRSAPGGERKQEDCGFIYRLLRGACHYCYPLGSSQTCRDSVSLLPRCSPLLAARCALSSGSGGGPVGAGVAWRSHSREQDLLLPLTEGESAWRGARSVQSSCMGRVRKAAGGAGLFAGPGGCWGAGRTCARPCEHADFKGVPEKGVGLPRGFRST